MNKAHWRITESDPNRPVQAQRIESIEIRNYRLFRHISWRNLPPMVVIIGANGSGKTTFFDVLAFLKDALHQNVAAAVTRRGGFSELVSRGTQGPIQITVKFHAGSGRLVTYHLAIASPRGSALVDHEYLQYQRGQRGKPWRLLDFRKGVGQAIAHESAYGAEGAVAQWDRYALDDPSLLAIKGLGQLREFRVVAALRSLLESWYVSDFRFAEARSSAAYLSPRGDNLAQVAQSLFAHHPASFDQVLAAMRQRIPGVSHVDALSPEDGRLVLRMQDGNFRDPFRSRHVSDGTTKMFAYLVLLYHPQFRSLLAVEQPEKQLYPRLLPELTAEFRAYARRGGQVFIATHSPELLNCMELHEIAGLVKQAGFSTVKRAHDSALLHNLTGEGDRPGELWKQGLLLEEESL